MPIHGASWDNVYSNPMRLDGYGPYQKIHRDKQGRAVPEPLSEAEGG